jgi:hypothetical protein
MSETIIRLSEKAVRLTDDFQKLIGSPAAGIACENALHISTKLIADEEKGVKPLLDKNDESSTFSLLDIMQEAASDRTLEDAAAQPTRGIILKQSQLSDIEKILSYGSEITDKPEDAYLLAIMVAHKLYNKFGNNRNHERNQNLSLDMKSKNAIEKQYIWLR